MSKILVALFVFGAVALTAQPTALERITIEDGLSQGMVFDILQDKEGFLWFATKDGLNRYDGYRFKQFIHNPFDPNSISGNTITQLLEDQQGRLWVGTDQNGLNLFDKQSERFFHLKNTAVAPQLIASNKIRSIIETPDGAVWIGTDKGITWLSWKGEAPVEFPSSYDLTHNLNIRLFHFKNDSLGHFSDNYYHGASHLTPDGKLMLGTMYGGYTIDPLKIESQPFEITDNFRQNIQLVDLDGQGNTWVSSFGQLMFKENNVWQPFGLPPPFDGYIRIARFGPDHHLYAVAENYFLKIAPSGLSASIRAVHVLDEREGVHAVCLESDSSGNMWVGTSGYGLRKYNPANSRFKHLLAGTSMRNILPDSKGNIWVYDQPRFLRLDEEKNELEQDVYPIKRHMIDVLETRDEKMLIGINNYVSHRGNTIIFVKKENGKLAEHPFPLNVQAGKLMEDHQGLIWKTASNGDLVRFNPKTGKFRFFNYGHLVTNSLYGYALMEDVNHHLWIGTPEGLVKGVPAGDSLHFSFYENNPSNRHSLNNNVVLSLHDDLDDPKRLLWIGTKGGGLNLLDKTTGQIKHFTMKDGLPNNVVYGILADELGYLWLSTNRGLSRFHPKRKTFENFTVANGLQDNEFNTLSFAKGKDGRLFFGGINGLTIFNPNDFEQDDFQPPVYITSLKINNIPVSHQDSNGILTKPIEQTGAVTLTHTQNLVTLEFAALDFSIPSKNQYRYFMEGVDPDWIEAGHTNFTTYTNLAPGHYIFKVMGSNSSGGWNKNPTALAITILPPWWKSTLAYASYLFLLFCGLYGIYRFQINRVKLRNQLEFEQREAERLTELNRLKTDFFSNITHEFRTPLTLIIEPLRQIIPRIKDPYVAENVKLANKNSHHLLQLVNQLLDLSKLEHKKMKLDLRKGKLEEIIRPIFQSFLPLANKKGIRLKFHADKNIPSFYFDKTKIEQVVRNLLSNAIKFTPEGNVLLAVRKNGEENIQLEVTDEGPGIAPAELPKIFDRFYQVDASSTRRGTGTGIGLSLTKELVELMEGTIEVNSKVKEGTTFRVYLPIRHDEFQVPLPAAYPTLQTDQASSPKDNLTAPAAPPPSKSRHQVLLIEDNADMRRFIAQSLHSAYQVIEASNGDEGIQKALDLVPDLIISDVMMPEKDGFELTRILKNDVRTSHIPIILLTAKSTIENKIAGLQRGADAYLSKPFNTEELKVRIEKLLELRLLLQKKFSQRNGHLNEEIFEQKEHAFIRRFMLLLEEELDNEHIKAGELAKRMTVSRSQLHRKLTALCGQSTSEFVRNYRLDRAMALLKNREGNVSQVCLMVGMGNRNYFTKTFKEKFGVLPSEV